MKTYLLTFLAALLLLLSCWGGAQVREAVLRERWNVILAEGEKKVHDSERQVILANTRGCLFYMDAQTLRYLHNPTVKGLEDVLRTTGACRRYIDLVLKNEIDKDIRWTLSEAQLFYYGYSQSLRETLFTQLALLELYESPEFDTEGGILNIMMLDEILKEQVGELGKFTARISDLIRKAW